jgi:hypothetical protein
MCISGHYQHIAAAQPRVLLISLADAKGLEHAARVGHAESAALAGTLQRPQSLWENNGSDTRFSEGCRDQGPSPQLEDEGPPVIRVCPGFEHLDNVGIITDPNSKHLLDGTVRLSTLM